MKSKVITGIMLAMLFMGMLPLAFKVQQVKADWTWTETIYIRADETAIATGKEFVLPITGWDSASVEFANPEDSSASVTVKIYNSGGSLTGTWSSTVPPKGYRSTWDFIGNIYLYANPAVVEITSDQPLLAMNRRWTDDPMAGVGFEVLPLRIFEPSSVGGIYVPTNKLELLAPYIALTSAILVATATTAIYIKHRNKKQ